MLVALSVWQNLGINSICRASARGLSLHSNVNQETATYLINFVLGAILAGLITNFWWHHRQIGAMRYWMISAWIMTVADVLFAARSIIPYSFARSLPTLMVTLGHASLLLGVQRTVGVPRRWGWVAALLVIHLAALIFFMQLEQPTHWRMVFNAMIWAGLSLAAARGLRKASWQFWKPLPSPATVFLIHGVFHCLRVVCAIGFANNQWDEASATLQVVSDFEVSFFMVSLFVGLLIAHLQLRHEELTRTQVELHTLSGLLPVCAWCKKVRDDAGYWLQVESYLEQRSKLKFTHCICVDCLDKVKKEQIGVPTA